MHAARVADVRRSRWGHASHVAGYPIFSRGDARAWQGVGCGGLSAEDGAEQGVHQAEALPGIKEPFLCCIKERIHSENLALGRRRQALRLKERGSKIPDFPLAPAEAALPAAVAGAEVPE